MTTTPDFRVLAQELLQHAREAQAILIGEGLWDVDDDEGLFDRADKALATPPPEPPTDEELEKLADHYMVMDGATGSMSLEHLHFARAVLEMWGHA